MEQVDDEAERLAVELLELPDLEELGVFDSIQELNWAWLYFSMKE